MFGILPLNSLPVVDQVPTLTPVVVLGIGLVDVSVSTDVPFTYKIWLFPLLVTTILTHCPAV